MRNSSLLLLILCGCVSTWFAAVAWADDEVEWQPGLIAEYRSGDRSIRRIEPTMTLLTAGEAPLEGLDAEHYSVTWTGHLLVRDAKATLHFWLQGALKVQIGEAVVFDGQQAAAGWASTPEIPLEFGFQPIRVTFQNAAPSAALKVFWSTEAFPLEPLPYHQLFHAQELVQGEQQLLWNTGRQLFTAHRCDRCHAVNAEAESPPAPALWGVTLGLNPDWLTQKLLSEHAGAAESNMPQFGFDKDEAAAISAYLIRLGSPSSLVSVPKVDEDQKTPPPTGEELLNGLGCLGCHQVGDVGTPGPFAGPNLSHIGAKRSPEWLATWLFRPERINPQHQMPVFKLGPTERAQLIGTLAKLGHTEETRFIDESGERHPAAVIDHGRDLVKKFRCANCHKIPAIEADRRDYSNLRDVASQEPATTGCLGTTVNKDRGQPVFPEASRAALRVYVDSLRGAPDSPLPELERGRRVLEQNNCLGCHARDGAAGLAPIAGQVAQRIETLRANPGYLIPPNLTAIGDKLLDAGLAKSISGEQDRLRQDWLKVQMPRFTHAARDKQALQSFLVSHDRIPEHAPDPRFHAGMQSLAMLEAPDATNLPNATVLGRQLIGAGGFSCIACHQVGDYRPRNVAQGARGSDLRQSVDRLRPEFYFRWTRAPLRIIPGMEMPAYQRAVPHVLNDDLALQLALVWKALQDPTFEAPTNPAQVEQFLVVAPDSAPRIVRDVFELPKATGGYVSRSFAVGFSNGHAVLFDLDAARLQQWTYGDFARQKAEGKSWFWELAGVPVPEFMPQTAWHWKQGAELQAVVGEETDAVVRLKSYHVDPSAQPSGVSLHYDITVTHTGQPLTLEFHEHWTTVAPDSTAAAGWLRTIQVAGVPAELQLVLAAGIENTPHNAGQQKGTQIVFSVPYLSRLAGYIPVEPPQVPLVLAAGQVTTFPGYDGMRLPLPESVMPTAMAWTPAGELLFTSLKGHVYGVRDTDNDQLGDELKLIDAGLAAPFGLLVDGDDLLVTHKPETLRIHNVMTRGQLNETAGERSIAYSGWGYSEDYHDWTTGPVRDKQGNMYLAIGSDYPQDKRPLAQQRWRGTIIQISPNGTLTPIARELRYPIGLALDAQDRLFATDQQGVQNTYNELNHIVAGRRYGVPSREDLREELAGFSGQPTGEADTKDWPAIQIPHPWTRSVNGLFFLPLDGPFQGHPFAGHGVGCEYNGRFLIRCSLQAVDGELQGAVYPLTRIPAVSDTETFLGPICGGVAPNGDIYIGSIHDSGWLGGRNTGELVRLRRNAEPLPNGIREIRLTADGFEIDLIHAITAEQAQSERFVSLTAATRKWSGSYASEDTDRHAPRITRRTLFSDGKTLQLTVETLRRPYVYEFQLAEPENGAAAFFPNYAAYTVKRLVKLED